MNTPQDLAPEPAQVEKSNESMVGPYDFIFAGDTLITWDVNADLDEGDCILRKLPNGKIQRLTIDEVTFNKQISSIPAYYKIKYSKGTSRERPVPNQTINIHSAQAVQIGDHNTQQFTTAIQSLVQRIESSEASEEEKSKALDLLQRFLAHPLVAAVVGATISVSG